MFLTEYFRVFLNEIIIEEFIIFPEFLRSCVDLLW